jgi:hypothetical protein
MPCSGCAERREALRAVWQRIKGSTLRSESVLLSGSRAEQAIAETLAEEQRAERGPMWKRMLNRRPMQP